MSQRATFACTALLGTNKVGELKKTDDGYYIVVLGALDVFNSAGAYYPYDSAKDVFKESSSLMRRIANGALRGEYGHPKRQPNQSLREFVDRVLQIDEKNVAFHIRKVTVDFTSVKGEDGRPVIALIGEIKPSGPFAHVLEKQLENPSENVCFSIRSLTDDTFVAGKLHKHIRTVVCWDYVNEPGISVATKWKSPALEGLGGETMIPKSVLESIEKDTCGVSFESSGGVSPLAVIDDFSWNKPKARLPGSAQW
jgi:hypothetical protein